MKNRGNDSRKDSKKDFSHIGPPLLVSVGEACYLLRIGRTKLYELMAEGQIETRKISSRRHIVRASLDRLMEEGA